MVGSDDLRYTRIALNNGSGAIPALGFGTLIPDPVATRPKRTGISDRKGQAFHGPLCSAKISARLDRDNQRISGNEILTAILGVRTVCKHPRRSPDGNRSLAID
jgi:hypothetical protein